MLASQPAVRARHLKHPHAMVVQVTSQSSTVGAGALDTDTVESTLALHPLQHQRIAARRRRELCIGEKSSVQVDHRGVMCRGVGIDAADD